MVLAMTNREKRRFNESKRRVLIALYDFKPSNGKRGLSIKQLAHLTNVSLKYIGDRIGKWCDEWNYVLRYAQLFGSKAVCVYRISRKGRRYIRRNIPVAKYNEILAEIRQRRDKSNGLA